MIALSSRIKRRSVLRAALAGAIVLTQAGLIGESAAEASFLRRRLRFTLTFHNPGAQALTRQLFWCYLPAERVPVQVLRTVQVSEPHQIHHDFFGHRILALSFPYVAAQAHKIVTLTTEVVLQPDALDTVMDDAPSPSFWLRAQHAVESDDPRILTQAAALRQATPKDTARSIYDWVIQHMTYAGYLADERGAVQALVHKYGDCTEYADLVAALGRAAGIPARVVGGYVVDRDTTPRPQDYHDWAELYFDGGWRLVDAQKQHWMTSPGLQYIMFRIHHDEPVNSVGRAQRYRIDGGLKLTF